MLICNVLLSIFSFDVGFIKYMQEGALKEKSNQFLQELNQLIKLEISGINPLPYQHDGAVYARLDWISIVADVIEDFRYTG